MTQEPHKDEPEGLTDLPLQPTGSGVADEQTAFEQAELIEDEPVHAEDPAAATRDPDCGEETVFRSS